MTLQNCEPTEWANPARPMPEPGCPVCSEVMTSRNRTRQWLDAFPPPPLPTETECRLDEPPDHPNQDDGGLPVCPDDARAVCGKCNGSRLYYWVDWVTKCSSCNGTGKAK